MKAILFPLSLLMLLSFSSFKDGGRKYYRQIKQHRAKLEAEFKDPEKSPLRDAATTFKGNNYYKIDPDYQVKARFERTEEAASFEMPTSNPDRQKSFVKYGILHFELKGESYQLSVYRNLGLAGIPQYEDYLFLPFTDLSNGQETYGGGRYMDMTVPKSEVVSLDFNLCYNPYCAYSTGWSCPVPPSENFLNTKIEAGVKMYEDH